MIYCVVFPAHSFDMAIAYQKTIICLDSIAGQQKYALQTVVLGVGLLQQSIT